MKIKADLSKLDTEQEVLALRVAATAILQVLPRDAAEDVILDWARLTGADLYPLAEVNAGEADAAIAARQPDPEGDYEAGEISPEPEPSEAVPSGPEREISSEPEPEPELEPDQEPGGKGPTYQQFTFGGRQFSTKKRGPKAALDHAVKLAQECGSVAELDTHRDALSNLCGILLEIGRPELIDVLNREVAAARAAMEQRDDPDGRAAPDTTTKAPDTTVAETEAEPEAVEVGPDTSTAPPDTSGQEQDEIPFDVEPDRSAVGSGEVENRKGPPTPRPGNGAVQEGAPDEPLRDLLRRAMKVIGSGRISDIIEHHGAVALHELDEAGQAAVRRDVLAAMDEAAS